MFGQITPPEPFESLEPFEQFITDNYLKQYQYGTQNSQIRL